MMTAPEPDGIVWQTSSYSAANGGCGVRMPFGGAAMSADEIACVQSWANSVTKP